jgi:hypothetical protein
MELSWDDKIQLERFFSVELNNEKKYFMKNLHFGYFLDRVLDRRKQDIDFHHRQKIDP